MTREPILAETAVTVDRMTDQATPASTSTVIPAPPGLSIVHKSGGSKPIVALHVTTNGSTIPDVTALYLDSDGTVKPVTDTHDHLEAWGGLRRAVHDNTGDFYN